MRLTTFSITLSALLLVGAWTLSACTVRAVDGTEYQLYTPTLAVEVEPDEPTDPTDPTDPTGPGEPGDDADGTVIVQFDDQALVIRPIVFNAPISGLDALELTRLELTIAETGFGPAVCAIEGVGCPADDCFCGGDFFWAYNYWADAAWQSYPVGASSSVISETGVIEGWRWGEWGAAAVPAPQAQAAQAGLDWLAARQDAADGSYSNSVGGGLDVLLALGANRQRGESWRRADDAPSLLDFTQANGAAYAGNSVSQAGKLALALGAAQGCYPADAPLPAGYYDAELGAFAPEAGPLALTILGVLALDAALTEDGMLESSVAYLRGLAQPEGGWEWFPGWGVDTNTTALAIQALVAAGVEVDAPEIVAAVETLRAGQNEDGGFPYDPLTEGGAPSDTNSTSYVIQGLIAAGQDAGDVAWQPGGQSPVDYLLGHLLEDGAFMWQAGQEGSQLSTQQAVPALLGRTYPLGMGTLAVCQGTAE